MSLKLVTPPEIEPVMVLEVKNHLRIDSTTEDDLLSGFITAAREYCEGVQNRAYITQEWELALDRWPDVIGVPLPPLQTVDSIKYYGTDGTEYTLDPERYQVSTRGYKARIAPVYGDSWPTISLRPLDGIVVAFTAGYGDDRDDVPEKTRVAIKLLAGHFHENREATDIKQVNEVPFAVRALLGLDGVGWI